MCKLESLNYNLLLLKIIFKLQSQTDKVAHLSRTQHQHNSCSVLCATSSAICLFIDTFGTFPCTNSNLGYLLNDDNVSNQLRIFNRCIFACLRAFSSPFELRHPGAVLFLPKIIILINLFLCMLIMCLYSLLSFLYSQVSILKLEQLNWITRKSNCKYGKLTTEHNCKIVKTNINNFSTL